ncbi:MAG: hypothetical protein AAFR32_08660 [Pseudomonadota bacterium]
MTGFEWTAIGLIVFGMVIPFWLMTIFSTIVLYQQQKLTKPPKRKIVVHDYAKLMKAFEELLKPPVKDGNFNGPTMMVYLRELREYPQYRDTSLLFLEEISITGSKKFDDLCKAELKSIEDHLLGLENE